MPILFVNGDRIEVAADPSMPLLWALRDLLGLTGTKYGCGAGLCGSCTVHVDGQPVRSCVTTLESVEERSVTTIEGLAIGGELHPVQTAWIEGNVPQCGYCHPGQIMSAVALLASTPNPTDQEIDDAMAGNLCRCGTYLRIRDAIHRLADSEGGGR